MDFQKKPKKRFVELCPDVVAAYLKCYQAQLNDDNDEDILRLFCSPERFSASLASHCLHGLIICTQFCIILIFKLT